MTNSAERSMAPDQDSPPPSWRRGPRTWLAAAVATAIVIAAVAAISAGVGTRDPDGSDPRSSAGTGNRQNPDLSAGAPTDLVVHDGDDVQAEGLLIAAPGQPVEVCPTLPVITIYPPPPPSCAGFGLQATGVDLDQVDGEVRDGIFVASVRFHGIYQGREIQIVEIGPAAPSPDQPAEDEDIREEPPCAPPPDGWRPTDPEQHVANLDALQGYLSTHNDRFNGLRVVYPPSATWDPAAISYDVEVYVVGVSAGAPQEALEELRSEFGVNVCTVAVDHTSEGEQQTREALERLADDRSNGIYSYGSGNGFEPVPVEILVLDERMYGELDEIGFANLDVTAWLTPAADALQ